MKALPLLVVLLLPALASANDPMAGWYLQQQAQRGRASSRVTVPRSTTLVTPRPTLKRTPVAKPAAVKPAAVEEKGSEHAPVETAGPEADRKPTPEVAPAEAIKSPGVAYRLGRMVRHVLDAVSAGARKKPAAVASEGGTASREGRAPAFALSSPRPAQKAASPGTLYLLRRARLITEADYQASLLRFLGAR